MGYSSKDEKNFLLDQFLNQDYLNAFSYHQIKEIKYKKYLRNTYTLQHLIIISFVMFLELFTYIPCRVFSSCCYKWHTGCLKYLESLYTNSLIFNYFLILEVGNQIQQMILQIKARDPLQFWNVHQTGKLHF